MGNKLIEEMKSRATFRIDTDDYDWFCSYPDMIFEIILDAVPTREQTAIAVTALEQFVEGYNKWHFLRPIHYVSDIDHLPDGPHPRGIYIHIDFGNWQISACGITSHKNKGDTFDAARRMVSTPSCAISYLLFFLAVV